MADFATIYDDVGCICDCCQRNVPRVGSSMWHGDHKICTECFCQWYDPDNGSFDSNDPVQLGNYVRSKHGLPPLDAIPHTGRERR